MRRTGAAFFLGDTAFLSDAKFRKLARRLTDPDDFNSAVGAYWVALAAARRNGRRQLDVETETGSRFLDDLRAVGLLEADGFPTEPFDTWAPLRPQQSFAGKVRAASGQRDERGRMLPAYASGTSALDALDDAGSLGRDDGRVSRSNVQRAGPSRPASTPVLSTQLTEGGPGETDETPVWLRAWLSVKMRMPTARQQAVLDSYLGVFDVSGPERAERVILSHPADPLGAIIADLAAFREERKGAAAVAEAEAVARRKVERRGFRPGSVEYELAQQLYAKDGTR